MAEACSELDDPVIINVSAPGKLILHGEHAVVHGELAIAASLGLRAYLHLETNSSKTIHLQLADLDLNIKFDIYQFPEIPESALFPTQLEPSVLKAIQTITENYPSLQQGLESRRLAVDSFLYLYCSLIKGPLDHSHSQASKSISSGHQGIAAKVTSDLPIGAGLGSSAAYSACMVAAMLVLVQGEAKDVEVINRWAFLSESIIHGNPSGLDNTISCHVNMTGGAVSFAAGNFTRLKSFARLQAVLVDTGIPRSTKQLVSAVRDRKETFPTIMNPILNAIGALSSTALKLHNDYAAGLAGEEPTYASLETLITMNHQLLNAIGVGHPALDKIVTLSQSMGFAAKLTGAGGGGCAFILLQPSHESQFQQKLLQALDEHGLKYWLTTLGGSGVTIDHVIGVNLL
eukprot:gene4280-6597_t